MAENQKIIDGFLDENGNPLPMSGSIVRDKATGKTFSEHLADADRHVTKEAINTLIENSLKPLQTTLNTFLSGDPDDNGTVDRLKELVAAINANKDSIDRLLAVENAGTGIAFVNSAEDTPDYSGKIRMIVSEIPAAPSQA